MTVLEGLEPVRKRPGMYIGSTGVEGLHHLIWEIFDNSRDEAMGGFCSRIEVALLPSNRVRIVDNGRGIPVDIHKATKVSALETVMTTLHAGGKFGGDGSGYKVSGGLHGVGASVVNALSQYAKVNVHRDGGEHAQEYVRGKQKAKVKKIAASKLHGTVVLFDPDPEIFSEIKWNWNTIVNHLRQQAYLVKGVEVNILDLREYAGKIDLDRAFYLKDEIRNVPSTSFFFEEGLYSLVKFYNKFQTPIHREIFYVEKQEGKVNVEIALQYIDDIASREIAFANNTHNSEGGMHVTGFRTALTRTLNDYVKKNGAGKEAEDGFTGDDVREGLTAVISVKMSEIQFEGQTKAKLGSVEARGATEAVFGTAFATFLEEHPDDAKAIIQKVVLALKARKAAKAAKDSVLRKGALGGMTLPGKLADCQSRSAEESEIFIVEGDSAGGTAKTGRDRKTQAVLPLRGKILNIERARLDKMLASEQIRNLVVAMGTAIGDVFDITKLRYHKIIIATDADVDGAHIRTLLLTLLYRHFRPLLDAGHIYIAQPPLYKVKKGKETHYFYLEQEKNAFLAKEKINPAEFETPEAEEGSESAAEEPAEAAGEEAGPGDIRLSSVEALAGGKKKPSKLHIQRYKGLGEMNAEELWETTMDPAHRVLKQVTIDDAQAADKTFDLLMGSEVGPRKSFITSNAKLANLDV
ncbi:MAG: DNA topoisomerase IV subunit B [Candidatus Lloydbacteria bacterium RIFCSPLOWO2_01_FULL_50_20]|uniref:DNA topoisomerase (ATP-hydrolyzing) n=1 Tax=Candidatus Lloydbacteria bacterium RIFCSPLOWO2_01_FULL_50_20 TaxID=1798665 RepID=A0A1G2DF23_9BACT|nr:MAG: DNA topoisomerase IV subunit B [Candidatus Lloydbacteria bacterium RIFCSPHIGHO2_02_FULL_50_11]OGZ12235.1 MAG: DNA topoisomerase IV subunit B [Candidatus Lloydbacteria bacterium RIFCSPLOWO2_01_FULL_50_20]